MRFIVGAVLFLWHIASAWGDDPATTAISTDANEDGAALVAAREAALDVVRVDNGDGTWSYIAPVPTPSDITLGVATLRYDGQVAYADAAVPNGGTVTWVEPDYVLTGPEYDPWEYFDVRVVDAAGQRWVTADIDYDAIVSDLPDDAAEGETPGVEWNQDAGIEHVVDLTTFTEVTCGGATAFWQSAANGDRCNPAPYR